MKLMPLQKKIFTIALTVFVLLVLVLVFVIYPSLKHILELKHNITVTETYLEEQYQKNRNLKGSIRKIDDVEMEIAKYRFATLKTGEELRLITDLENVAEQSGIKQNLKVDFIDEEELKEIKRTTAKNKKDTGVDLFVPTGIHYQLSFLNQGSFADHIKYLQLLEKLDYYVIINSLNFEQKNLSTNGDGLSTSLRFEAFVYANQDEKITQAE